MSDGQFNFNDINLDFLELTPPSRQNQQQPEEVRWPTPYASAQFPLLNKPNRAGKTKQLAQRISDTDNLVQQIQSLESERSDLQNRLEELRLSANDIQKLYESEKQQRCSLENNLQTLQVKCTQLEEELVDTTYKNDQLQAQCDEAKGPIEYNELVVRLVKLYRKLDEDSNLHWSEQSLLEKLRKYCEDKSLNTAVVKSPKKKTKRIHKTEVAIQCELLNPIEAIQKQTRSQSTQHISTVTTRSQGIQHISTITTRSQGTQHISTITTRSQGTQHISTATTRGTSTVNLIQKCHVGTSFPEPIPLPPLNDMLEELLGWDHISPISPISESDPVPSRIPSPVALPVVLKTIGTCTYLCNVQRQVDYIPTIKRSNSRPPSRLMCDSIKHELNPPSPTPFNANSIPIEAATNNLSFPSLANIQTAAFDELWQVFGQMLLGLLQRRNGGVINSFVNNSGDALNQRDFQNWLRSTYDSLQQQENIATGFSEVSASFSDNILHPQVGRVNLSAVDSTNLHTGAENDLPAPPQQQSIGSSMTSLDTSVPHNIEMEDATYYQTKNATTQTEKYQSIPLPPPPPPPEVTRSTSPIDQLCQVKRKSRLASSAVADEILKLFPNTDNLKEKHDVIKRLIKQNVKKRKHSTTIMDHEVNCQVPIHAPDSTQETAVDFVTKLRGFKEVFVADEEVIPGNNVNILETDLNNCSSNTKDHLNIMSSDSFTFSKAMKGRNTIERKQLLSEIERDLFGSDTEIESENESNENNDPSELVLSKSSATEPLSCNDCVAGVENEELNDNSHHSGDKDTRSENNQFPPLNTANHGLSNNLHNLTSTLVGPEKLFDVVCDANSDTESQTSVENKSEDESNMSELELLLGENIAKVCDSIIEISTDSSMVLNGNFSQQLSEEVPDTMTDIEAEMIEENRAGNAIFDITSRKTDNMNNNTGSSSDSDSVVEVDSVTEVYNTKSSIIEMCTDSKMQVASIRETKSISKTQINEECKPGQVQTLEITSKSTENFNDSESSSSESELVIVEEIVAEDCDSNSSKSDDTTTDAVNATNRRTHQSERIDTIPFYAPNKYSEKGVVDSGADLSKGIEVTSLKTEEHTSGSTLINTSLLNEILTESVHELITGIMQYTANESKSHSQSSGSSESIKLDCEEPNDVITTNPERKKRAYKRKSTKGLYTACKRSERLRAKQITVENTSIMLGASHIEEPKLRKRHKRQKNGDVDDQNKKMVDAYYTSTSEDDISTELRSKLGRYENATSMPVISFKKSRKRKATDSGGNNFPFVDTDRTSITDDDIGMEMNTKMHALKQMLIEKKPTTERPGIDCDKLQNINLHNDFNLSKHENTEGQFQCSAQQHRTDVQVPAPEEMDTLPVSHFNFSPMIPFEFVEPASIFNCSKQSLLAVETDFTNSPHISPMSPTTMYDSPASPTSVPANTTELTHVPKDIPLQTCVSNYMPHRNTLLCRLTDCYSSKQHKIVSGKLSMKELAERTRCKAQLSREIANYLKETVVINQESEANRLVQALQGITDNYDLITAGIVEQIKIMPRANAQVTYSPEALPNTSLSAYHQRISYAIKQLQCIREDFTKELLAKIENTLFNFQAPEKLNCALNLTQLYLLLIFKPPLHMQTNPARTFIAKCLYCYQQQFAPMVYEVLSWFPTVLPHREDRTYDRSDALVTVIQHVLMCTKYDMDDSELCTKEILSKLRFEYHFEPFKPSRADVLANLVAKLKAGKMTHLSYAFAVLCKRTPVLTVTRDVLQGQLLPLAEEYYKLVVRSSDYDERIATLLECLSLVIKPFPLETDVSEYLCLFGRFLNVVQRPLIQEAALQAVLRLQQFGCVNCWNVLRHFTPYFELRPQTKAMLNTFVHRKPLDFWKAVKTHKR